MKYKISIGSLLFILAVFKKISSILSFRIFYMNACKEKLIFHRIFCSYGEKEGKERKHKNKKKILRKPSFISWCSLFRAGFQHTLAAVL